MQSDIKEDGMMRDLQKDLKRLEESQKYFLKHGNECLVMDLGISIEAINRAIKAEELLRKVAMVGPKMPSFSEWENAMDEAEKYLDSLK
jgi:hypothetical protein